MRISDFDAAGRETLYVLCEDWRTVGGNQICYRLYASLAPDTHNRFFVSIVEGEIEDAPLVPRDGLEEAAALYRTLLRATVTPCHFLDIVEDLDGLATALAE
ncbi:MAG: hypothetical protein IJC99_04295 [Clostridia bacterium]|nr:hypothetical protein [Clostridia bacterium]